MRKSAVMAGFLFCKCKCGVYKYLSVKQTLSGVCCRLQKVAIAFNRCWQLQEVALPECVKETDDFAFHGCVTRKSVIFS